MSAIIGRNGQPANSNEIRQMLGLPEKAKLPPNGIAPQSIQGVTVYVEPLRVKRNRTRRMKHRVLAICPHCSRIMSVGRLSQHKCKVTK